MYKITMRIGFFLAFAALLGGCAHSGITVERESDLDIAAYQRIGVLPFRDSSGKGNVIAQDIEDGLKGMGATIVDRKALVQILEKYKPDPAFGISVEGLLAIRTQTSADAILLGNVSVDHKSAAFSLIETEMGNSVIRATLKPRRWRKNFANPKEVAAQILYILGAAQ